jgi:hypothetical protein
LLVRSAVMNDLRTPDPALRPPPPGLRSRRRFLWFAVAAGALFTVVYLAVAATAFLRTQGEEPAPRPAAPSAVEAPLERGTGPA